MSYLKPRTALLSVSDKTGLVPFASGLIDAGVRLYATGGTYNTLIQAGLVVQAVESLTDLPAMLGGRVKTLHPGVMGGILADRKQHAEEIQEYGLQEIDLVVVNLYPFQQTIAAGDATHAELIEQIDIGGVTLLRSAAKNHRWVAPVTRSEDYATVLSACNGDGLGEDYRQQLATIAFAATLGYEQCIYQYFASQSQESSQLPPLTITATQGQALTYGENPDQTAIHYFDSKQKDWALLQGKALSYNNWFDIQAGLDALRGLSSPSIVIIKHGTPCGMASAQTLLQAFEHAYACYPDAAFGGVVVANREIDPEFAGILFKHFTECVVAPTFEQDALALFATKSNKRLLQYPVDVESNTSPTVRRLSHGWLQQSAPPLGLPRFDVVVGEALSQTQQQSLIFAWRVARAVLSNAVVLCQQQYTVGIGGGQVSRVAAAEQALAQAGERAQGAIMASDGFLPFADSVHLAAKAGISLIVEPGGSKRDQTVIDACEQHGICLVFTGQRVFRH